MVDWLPLPPQGFTEFLSFPEELRPSGIVRGASFCFWRYWLFGEIYMSFGLPLASIFIGLLVVHYLVFSCA